MLSQSVRVIFRPDFDVGVWRAARWSVKVVPAAKDKGTETKIGV